MNVIASRGRANQEAGYESKLNPSSVDDPSRRRVPVRLFVQNLSKQGFAY